jgi:hypothetical protein
VVHQVAEFAPPQQQPAAALGGFLEPAHKHGRLVVAGRVRVAFFLGPDDVQQLAAELANLLELPRAWLLGLRGLPDAGGQVSRLDPLGAPSA